MAEAVRHTVCPAVVGTVTSYIMWADAEHAAAIGAAPVSPYKPKSPTDREWTRRYNQARQCIRISGFTQSGLRACNRDGYHITPAAAALVARYNAA